jgi:hypothetical protein
MTPSKIGGAKISIGASWSERVHVGDEGIDLKVARARRLDRMSLRFTGIFGWVGIDLKAPLNAEPYAPSHSRLQRYVAGFFVGRGSPFPRFWSTLTLAAWFIEGDGNVGSLDYRDRLRRWCFG